MDLCAATDSILTPDQGIQLLPTEAFGPLPPGKFGLILGRGSLALEGLSVIPGVIDNDYTGQITLLASAPKGPVYIFKGNRIAQLILLPLDKVNSSKDPSPRGKRSFGSSNIYWSQLITPERPMLTLHLDGKAFEGLIDTGADATVIAARHWPRNWPSLPSITHLKGIGQTTCPRQSTKTLKWTDTEGNSGEIRPYIVPDLPVNLWGRDILSQLGLMMYSPNDTVTSQMLKQGYSPGQGLGKHGQGIKEPLVPTPQVGRLGLGNTGPMNHHFS